MFPTPIARDEMKEIVTVIFEVNCHVPLRSQQASLWVVKGDSTADPEGPYPEEDPNAHRGFGPCESSLVTDLEPRMKALLEFLGYEVRTDVMVDD